MKRGDRTKLADRALYVVASVMLTMHGLFHLWNDFMGIQGPKNPLFWLFGGGTDMGVMMHILEWPILFLALSVAFWNTMKED